MGTATYNHADSDLLSTLLLLESLIKDDVHEHLDNKSADVSNLHTHTHTLPAPSFTPRIEPRISPIFDPIQGTSTRITATQQAEK